MKTLVKFHSCRNRSHVFLGFTFFPEERSFLYAAPYKQNLKGTAAILKFQNQHIFFFCGRFHRINKKYSSELHDAT